MATIDAWNEGDGDAYWGSYFDPVECWYDAGSKPISQISGGPRGAHFRDRTASRLQSETLHVLEESTTEVVLRDEGRVVGTERESRYDKIMVMRPQGDEWKIAIEAAASQQRCYSPPSLLPGCRVTSNYTYCLGPAGGPPCRSREIVVASPPIPPDTRESDVTPALLAAINQYGGGACDEPTIEFGADGFVNRVSMGCMGGQMFNIAYACQEWNRSRR
jgi:hypothetical protein